MADPVAGRQLAGLSLLRGADPDTLVDAPGAGGLLEYLWIAMDRGRPAEAGELLDEGRAAAPEVRVWGRLLHALRAFKLGNVGGAEDGAARALELDPDDIFWRTVAALLRGVTGHARGRRRSWRGAARAARRRPRRRWRRARGLPRELGLL